MDPARGGPGTTVVWDTKACHTWYFVGYGQGNVANNYGAPPGVPKGVPTGRTPQRRLFSSVVSLGMLPCSAFP